MRTPAASTVATAKPTQPNGPKGPNAIANAAAKSSGSPPIHAATATGAFGSSAGPTVSSAGKDSTNDGKNGGRGNWVLPSFEEVLAPDYNQAQINTANALPSFEYYKNMVIRALRTRLRYFQSPKNHPKENKGDDGFKLKSDDKLKQALHRFLMRGALPPSMIKKVVIIGVHGWFPIRLIRTVIGEPIGTSQHFASKMAEATRSYFLNRHGITLDSNSITAIPLQGEGKVEDRVDILYRQLVSPGKGWVEKLREADLVLVAAHSQGVPVSTMLLARILRERILLPESTRICLLAMAGISHGPFPNLKSSLIVQYVEADAARQLFEFNQWNSDISIRFRNDMAQVLNSGTRIVAVGSWYDQVVPLYSGIMHAFDSPQIYRAIYIDSKDYNPDFLSHLVVFALRLRNAGISDRGLIVHLSEYLAGNVYGFGTQGHSAIYEEQHTYSLALSWALTDIPGNSLRHQNPHFFSSNSVHIQKPSTSFLNTIQQLVSQLSKPAPITDPEPPFVPSTSQQPILSLIQSSFDAPTRLNPYYIPWIMAELTSDQNITDNSILRIHLLEVLKLFRDWTPSEKALKELLHRLEPLKSKL